MRRATRPAFIPRGFQHRPQRIPVSRATFDVLRAEKFMNRANPVSDDSELATVMTERNSAITPTAATKNQALIDFMSVIEQAVDEVTIKNPSKKNEIREFHRVGSFQTQTMLVGHNTADVVAVLQCLPSHEVLKELSEAICEVAKTKSLDESDIEAELTKYGFLLKSNGVQVRFLVCTIPENRTKFDSTLHVSKHSCCVAFNAIRHTKWMENNCDHGLRILIRLLKDVRNRFPLMHHLSSRMIDVLAYYSVVNSVTKPPTTVPLPSAFKRAMQLMASGIFLPGSSGLADPVMAVQSRVNDLTLEQMDDVCRISQVLCRLLYSDNLQHLVFDGTPLEIDEDSTEPLPLFEGYPNILVYPRAFITPLSTEAQTKGGEKRENEDVQNVSDDPEAAEEKAQEDVAVKMCKVDSS